MSESADHRSPSAQAGSWYIAAFVVATAALLLLPVTLVQSLFWDDWSWYWIHHDEGPARVWELLYLSAHPGYAPPFTAIFSWGGDYAGVFGRSFAVACHLANGALLYRILQRAPLTRACAGLVAVLFLLSPYVVIRHSVTHSIYDPLLTCYLASILLTTARHWSLRGLGLILLLFALSLEILMALEFLRLLSCRDEDESWAACLRRCAPFWGVCGLVAVARFTVITPQEPYAHYNQVELNPGRMFSTLLRHFEFYGPRSIKFAARLGSDLVGRPAWVVTLVAAGMAGALLARRRDGLRLVFDGLSRNAALTLAGLGLLVLVVAALPLMLIGQAPGNNAFWSRFAVAGQFGALLLVAAVLLALPSAWMRGAAVAATVVGLTMAQVQNGKWLLYDELIQRHFNQALLAYLYEADGPRSIIVTLQPPSHEILFRNRCMSAHETNARLNLLLDPVQPPSFAFDAGCAAASDPIMLDPPECTISGRGYGPCATPRVNADYNLRAAYASVRETSLWQLLRHAVLRGGELPAIADFSVDGKAVPLSRLTPPSCLRRGGGLMINVEGLTATPPACGAPAVN